MTFGLICKKLNVYCLPVLMLLFVITISGLIACGGGGGGGDDVENDGGDSGQSLSITGESGNPVDMDGTWRGGCDPDLGAGTSEKSVITISGSSFSVTINHWLGSTNCSGTPDAEQEFGGSATLRNELTASMDGSNVTATAADLLIGYAEITVFNQDILTDLNADSECGYNDWEVNVVKNILGTECMNNPNQKDIMYINDTADPDIYYMGDEDGPLNANGYPTEIDLDSACERS